MAVNTIDAKKKRPKLTSIDKELIKLGVHCVPFKSKLSFAPLIEHIKILKNSEDFGQAFLAEEIMSRLEKAPELTQPIEDEDLEKLMEHKALLELMMLSFLTPINRDNQYVKVSKPFDLQPIYATPAAQKLMQEGKPILNVSQDMLYSTNIIRACSLILNKFYGQQLHIDPLMTFAFKEHETKLTRHFKVQVALNYTDAIALKPLKALSQEQINDLLSNIYDVDLWLRHIPPENFEIHGFVIGNMIDITAEQVLSQLKYKLLEKNAVVEPEKVDELERLLQSFFRLPNLKMGLTAIDYPKERTVAHKYKIRFDFLADKHPVLLAEENGSSIYEKACKYREILLIEDLEKTPNKTPIEKDLIKAGFRSIIVAPLFNKDKQVIGLLEIGSPKPYELHSFIEIRLKEIIGLFSMAMERSREEIDNSIEAVIREQYTAVHPSVEWKFVETSYNLLQKREQNEHAVPDPIIFEDVFPLYGQADIVSSSQKRNLAIRADLLDNLARVKKVLQKCADQLEYPLINQFMMKVDRSAADLEKEFNSNDETRIVELLDRQIHPLLSDVQRRRPELADTISLYFDSLDENLGIVYKERKDFEESVSILNNTISNYLEQQQKKWQEVLPHYFEKYKTDGVEYDLYVGQSLLKETEFRQMHLRNFRLWQLVDMCEITRKVKKLKNKLPVPLTTAQLIFAYNTPLSIRFRMDEKQFDVDGAYNVRYEILKKRIDKALIADTNDRLTVSGKIAIVYLQDKDKQEYLDYFDYLIHEGYITEEIEDLELGRLQGVQGLKALRITVKG